MFTIFKLIYANIRQKKFRSALIIISIALSVALMYTILSLSASTQDIFKQKLRKEIGNAQLMILPGERSGIPYLDETDFTGRKGISFAVPLISAYGYSKINDENVPVAFTGMSVHDYDTVYGLEDSVGTSDILKDNQIIIGKETAEVYQIKEGDNLKVTLAGEEKSFRVVGVIDDSNNNLGYDPGRLEVLIDCDALSNALGLKRQVSAYYLNINTTADKKVLMSDLQADFPDSKLQDLSDMGDYKQMLNMLVSSMFLMVSSVIMVSAFIIYSSFKIIAIERMPLMGTLRSIGATRKMTVRTLLYEAVFYGISGGIVGNGLGVLILFGTMRLMFRNFGLTAENNFCFNVSYFLIALLIGLILAIGSSVLPVVKISKKSIRSIIFSEIDNEKHTSVLKSAVGLLLTFIGFLIFNIAPLKLQMMLDIIGVLLVTFGGAMVIPLLSEILNRVLIILFRPIAGESLGIVSSNIKNDRTMMNNIMLLAMGLGIILMINNFSSAVSKAVSDVYSTGKMDAMAFCSMDEDFINNVRQVEGVEHVYTTKEITNLKANNRSVELLLLEGIDGNGYCKYAWDEFGGYLNEKVLKDFRQKRSIILSRFTAKKYDLEPGDVLELDFDGKRILYEVLAVVPSIMQNGNMSFVYEKFLTEDAGLKDYQGMYLNFNDNSDTKSVMQKIKELMPQNILPIQTLKEMRDQNVKSNNAVFYLMKAISLIAMFIGIVGILNNFTISFLNRKKLFATMRSLGLSKRKTVGNMMVEAFFCGCLGTLSGLTLGTVLLKAMCYMIEAMGIPTEVMFYNVQDYLFVLVSGIVISVISAVLPAISIAKENIVAGLKYE